MEFLEQKVIKMKLKNLTQIERNEELMVVKIDGGHHFKEKIEALGLRTGAKIQKLSTQILNGPVTVKVGSTKIAIGYGMAKKILIESKN